MVCLAVEAREYPTPRSLEAMRQTCKQVPNAHPNKNFLPVFLGHAKLYMFADMYDVDPLKALALNKLHQILLTFKLYARRVGDVVELVGYSYENTPSKDFVARSRGRLLCTMWCIRWTRFRRQQSSIYR